MLRWLKRGALALLVLLPILISLAALATWLLMRGSLPRLDGESSVPGLSAPVSIQRDDRGVVTIDADSESDAMRALGYLHAQERYFEMDLMRRTSAGELAELFGAVAVDTDKRHRVHRMRARVTRHLDTIVGDKRSMMQAYVDGVNAGLADLRVRPWPYLVLRRQPEPWTLEDSALTGYAMYFDLQDSTNARELALLRMRPHVPPALFALLTHDGSQWDAPIQGAVRGDAVVPTPDQVDLRALPSPATAMASAMRDAPVKGSNNFAVSGALTADGRAIVADDMHLGLRAPNIWFRARLRYDDPQAPGGRVDANGFTLPGLPAIVVGSNGHVAWAFTNSYGDWLDWQQIPACDDDTDPSATSACPGIRRTTERIDVAGGETVDFVVEETDWGPVLHRNPDGSRMALRWVAHLPGSLTLGLADLLSARTVDEALRVADHTAIPAQNMLVGDRDGGIAWRLLGPVPRRADACLATPAGLAKDTGAAIPNLFNGASTCPPWPLETSAGVSVDGTGVDRLWTANSRVVDGELLGRIGDGGYTLGARAKQIRDGLMGKTHFDERDLLAIQLDDRAILLERWWRLLREQPTQADTPALHALADAAAEWQGRAGIDSVGFRLVRAWRLAVHDRIAAGLAAPARAALEDGFEPPSIPQLEGVAWPLVTRQPAHLLPPRFDSWQALFEDAAVEVRDELSAQGPLAQRNWGERNTANICHPLSRALPAFARSLLCMPAEPLPGDANMPRVQGPDFGASERMVVSPGHEADGIIHMPGGQSGHPMSPFWGAGHDDWVHGRPTPFLPGEAVHEMQLSPQ
jgi:penicillin amidase